jgi:hypothetical protein
MYSRQQGNYRTMCTIQADKHTTKKQPVATNANGNGIFPERIGLRR